jgi:hypothetical protein
MWRRGIVWSTAMLVAGAIGASPASADSTPAGDFSFKFSSAEPGTPAGLEFRQLYKNPDDPDAKPSPVRRFLFGAPEGTVFDGGAVPACNATDQQFQQMGKSACPPESVVGTGFITVMTGIPGEQPYPLDATVFNSGDGIIELFTEQGTGAFLAIERPKFRGSNAFEDTDIAATPGGPPDGQSAAREAYIEFPLSRGDGGRSFITTPPECHSDGQWSARFEWTNADGKSYGNKHDMQCTRTPAVDGRRPVIRAAGIPRRCVDRSFKARFRIEDASALRSVRVTLGRRTLAQSRGKRVKVRVAVNRLRPGRHTVRVEATDAQGNRAQRRFHFRRCGRSAR